MSLSGQVLAMSLKIIVVPPAHELQWTSQLRLIKSFFKSQALSLQRNGFSDAQRRAIGHVVTKIECSSQVRWSSISINPINMVPLILKKGVQGMFEESSKGYMQGEEEIIRFVVNNAKNAVVMKFPIDQQSCEEMLVMDDAHRTQKKIWFGPLIETLNNYQSANRLGGSGSTYAVALKRLDKSTEVDLNRWVENVQLPGGHEHLSFYSAQKMWEFSTTEIQNSPLHKFTEKILYKNKEVYLNGIEF